ncbi:hypothetical protein EVAR_39250_1 [Eumeta japonica]|uniref:Uncharacterized protein n=1 Tax=Eumeta variegata TaxID=151549 RepID=A0A4C1Y3C2_EUMVA|nr:hypothetical protein EVAR_39250_1 [Eumeta japonica]
MHVMKQLVEKCQEHSKILYIISIDYSKALGSIKHDSPWKALIQQGTARSRVYTLAYKQKSDYKITYASFYRRNLTGTKPPLRCRIGARARHARAASPPHYLSRLIEHRGKFRIMFGKYFHFPSEAPRRYRDLPHQNET